MGFYANPTTSGQTVLTNSAQTTNFTAVANTLYTVNATTGAVTVTLPTSTTYQSILVKKTDSSVNTVTLSGTINGVASSTFVINKQNQSKSLYADGSGGWTIAVGDADLTTIGSSASTSGFLTAIGTSKVTISTTAPASPATGDLWIDTN
jgi:hypothetical protein